MKKFLSSIVLASAFVTAPVFAVSGVHGISEQMQAQQTQLRPQAFNFFSDRYRQLTAIKAARPKFKVQPDSQTELLRKQEFNPISDVYVQTRASHF